MSRPYACVKPVVAVLMRLFFRVEVKNPEHVPLAGAVLLVANHSSLLDPPLVGGVVPRQLSFLAKAELFRIPLFGPLIRRLNARPVRREGPDPGALRMALRVLEEDGAMGAAIARLRAPAATGGTRGVGRAAGRRGAGARPPEASL